VAIDRNDLIDWLARELRRAHVGAYVERFPHHEGATELFKEFPELREGGHEFYKAIARRLVFAGVTVADEPVAPKKGRQPASARGGEKGGLFE
jgi:hypothetical protein